MGWGCGRGKVLPLLGGFSCKVYLQHLSKILLLRHAFCFLSLATILESLLCSLKKKEIEAWFKWYSAHLASIKS
jgi:hypothetical protein